ncbi:hypothetical protein BSK20_00390 [SR1 bacterium human oral taxon HOT-345]|nr:hypothetical protein BSK20_00390 [SR1 bacterium human oral taxon HOT-345]
MIKLFKLIEEKGKDPMNKNNKNKLFHVLLSQIIALTKLVEKVVLEFSNNLPSKYPNILMLLIK